MSRRRKLSITLTVVTVFVVVIVVAFRYVRQRASAQKQAAFLARFEPSFNSGTMRLVGAPQVEVIDRILMPEFGPFTFRAPEVNEYVVTAQFERNDALMWGRWLYTTNGAHGDAIYKFSYAESSQPGALPSFPRPLQAYIPITTQLVDGIPLTAGASAQVVSVSSPIKVTDPITVTASAPAGTTCRVQIFPADALLSAPASKQPGPDGTVSWTCGVNPRYAGTNLSVSILCEERRGSKTLENSTAAPNVQVLP